MTISENKQTRGMDGFSGYMEIDAVTYLDSENEANLAKIMVHYTKTDTPEGIIFINGDVTGLVVTNVHGNLMNLRAEGRRALSDLEALKRILALQ